jgi:GNAT superfamily N-acetyltransferase
MSTPTLRRLTVENVDAFRALRLRALREHPRAYLQTFDEESDRPRRFHEYMIETNIILGAFQTNEVVGIEVLIGYTILTPNQMAKTKHKGIVWGAYVTPEHRHENLAQQMRLRLFEIAKSLGLKYCNSSIVANNPAALAVHRAVGYVEMFRETNGVRHADGSFDDVIHLVKYL